uniref:Uncharacterized protein n=1 Tax=Avena sativa TaxID=4498 RepID=A0ACD5TZA5_AVESA
MMKGFALVSGEQGMQMPMSMPVPVSRRGDRAPERAFVCKTCGRAFPSFQALGGHRASHKKPRMDGDGGELKPKLHGCSVCGLQFAIGQALGGHMRRHRAIPCGGGVMPLVAATSKHGAGYDDLAVGGGMKRGLWLDLNQPAACGDDDGWMDVDADASGECGFDSAAAGYTFHQFLDTGTMAVDCV